MRRIMVYAAWMLVGLTAPVESASPMDAGDRSAFYVAHFPGRIARKKKKPKNPRKPTAPEPTPVEPAPAPAPASGAPAAVLPPMVLPTPQQVIPVVPPRPAPAPPAASSENSSQEMPSGAAPIAVRRGVDGREAPAVVREPPPAEGKLPVFTVRVEPEWAYRRFLDVEPSATDKHFGTPGVFLLGGRAEVYPLASSVPLRDLGVVGSYARAISMGASGLSSTDLNTNKSVDTRWYHYSAGLKYRILGRSGPFTLGVVAGYERWVFDFDLAVVPAREIPTARYSFLDVGADARQSFGRFSLLFDAAYLQPFSVDPLGDRHASQRAYGVRAGLGVGLALGAFEAELGANFTLVRLQLDPAPGRSDEPGRVFDQYFGARLGIGMSF